MRKKLLKLFIVLFAGGLLSFVVYFFWPPYTPHISAPNGLSTLEYLPINGIEQAVLIRTEDTKNPILLFLHGGPGMPMMYLAHTFQKSLEKEFTVVHWDRRGAGKSYAKQVPSKESINIRQLMDDTYVLIEHLQKRFGHDKIFLVGHSFGSYLGSLIVKERPDLIKAYISIGQVVNEEKARDLQRQFIIKEAVVEEDFEVIEKINENPNIDYEAWLFKYGAELKNSTSFFPLIWEGLKSPEYSFKEVMKVAEGSQYSSAHMLYNVGPEGDIEHIKEYKVPVFFVVGNNDYVTPFDLVHSYFEEIKAPVKQYLLFKESAHFPFYEEPENFAKVLKDIKQKTIKYETK